MGWLPAGSQRKVSGHLIPLSQASPGAPKSGYPCPIDEISNGRSSAHLSKKEPAITDRGLLQAALRARSSFCASSAPVRQLERLRKRAIVALPSPAARCPNCSDDVQSRPSRPPRSHCPRGTTSGKSRYFAGYAPTKNPSKYYLFLPGSPESGFSIPPASTNFLQGIRAFFSIIPWGVRSGVRFFLQR